MAAIEDTILGFTSYYKERKIYGSRRSFRIEEKRDDSKYRHCILSTKGMHCTRILHIVIFHIVHTKFVTTIHI